MKEKDNQLRVLLVDDDEDEFVLLQSLIAHPPAGMDSANFSLDWVDSYEGALQAFQNPSHDIYLVDYHLGEYNGLDLLKEADRLGCEAPMIMLTGYGNWQVDMAAMQHGAADYLVKDQLNVQLLERSIRYALERRQAQAELERQVRERTADLNWANAELRQARDELEERVDARTAELSQANNQLEAANRSLEWANRRLAALHRATSALVSTLDLDRLLGLILDAAQSAIPAAERGALHLIAPDTGQLQVRSVFGRSDPRIQKMGRLLHDYPARVVAERRPLLITDAITAPGESSFRSAVIAPLILNENVLGALSLSASQPGAFTQGDLQLLLTFATTTTAAIQNAMLHAEVQQLAITDPLTSCYNRRAFFDLGQREVERFHRFGRPLAAIMWDIDHFKEVNDTYGHSTGDQVLKILVDRCRANIRQVDLLGRYGGDEFTIFLPETDLFRASEVAERIRLAVTSQPVLVGDQALRLTISLGVSRISSEIRDAANLVERADEALYAAKQEGRDRVRVR